MNQIFLNEVDLVLDLHKENSEIIPFLMDEKIIENFDGLLEKYPEGIKVILVKTKKENLLVVGNSTLIKLHPQIALAYLRLNNLKEIKICGGAKLKKNAAGKIEIYEKSILLGEMDTNLLKDCLLNKKLDIKPTKPYLKINSIKFKKFTEEKLKEIILSIKK